MKKTFALLLSFVALVAFLSAGAQNPKADKPTTKVEQTVETKASVPCCDSKGQTSAAAKEGCCSSKGEVKSAEAKTGCASAGKTCGGCSSKAKTQTSQEVPVPKK